MEAAYTVKHFGEAKTLASPVAGPLFNDKNNDVLIEKGHANGDK